MPAGLSEAPGLFGTAAKARWKPTRDPLRAGTRRAPPRGGSGEVSATGSALGGLRARAGGSALPPPGAGSPSPGCRCLPRSPRLGVPVPVLGRGGRRARGRFVAAAPPRGRPRGRLQPSPSRARPRAASGPRGVRGCFAARVYIHVF